MALAESSGYIHSGKFESSQQLTVCLCLGLFQKVFLGTHSGSEILNRNICGVKMALISLTHSYVYCVAVAACNFLV